MNKEFLNEFLKQICDLSKHTSETEYVMDKAGVYSKGVILDDIIFEAQNLIKYGEYRIALENTLENLNEVSITLEKEIVELARQAFGQNITKEMELLLSLLTK